jgi:hypothetical protein
MRRIALGLLAAFAFGIVTSVSAQDLTSPPPHVLDLRLPPAGSAAITPSLFRSKWTARHPVATGAIVGAAIGGVAGFAVCSEDGQAKGKCRVLMIPLTAGLFAPVGMLVGFLFFR